MLLAAVLVKFATPPLISNRAEVVVWLVVREAGEIVR